jgi:hypothetical protein
MRVVMRELEPIAPELLEFYQSNAAEFIRIAEVLGITRFTNSVRNELLKYLPDADAVSLVEAVFLLGDYGNLKEMKRQSEALAKLRKKDGEVVPSGKRRNRNVSRLVDDMTPLLLHFGVPLATSERSHLVLCLRLMSEQANLLSDPREQLRWLVAQKKKRTVGLMQAIRLAVTSGLKHLKISDQPIQPPPPNIHLPKLVPTGNH